MSEESPDSIEQVTERKLRRETAGVPYLYSHADMATENELTFFESNSDERE